MIGDLTLFCLFSIQSLLNTTSDDPEQQPAFVNDLVEQIENVSCPGNQSLCNGHGTCVGGHCVCDTGKLHAINDTTSN